MMEAHPALTARELKIVSEFCGRFGAQLLREQVAADRWPHLLVAVIVELSGQAVRMIEEDEVTQPGVTPVGDSEPPPAEDRSS